MSATSFVLESEWGTLLMRHTIQVTVLILFVGLVTRFWLSNRPRVAHVLWALVLLKCLTPPIVASPMSPFSWSLHSGTASLEDSTVSHPGSVDIELPTRLADASNSPQLKADVWEPVDTDAAVMASRPSPSAVEKTFSDSLQRPSQTPVPMKTGFSYATVGVVVWLAGSLVMLFLVSVRLLLFLRRVHRYRVAPHDQTVELLRATIEELQLTGKRIAGVRVQVVDSLIGPAVIGIWRPTILLPKVLEDESSRSELRLLLAHELVHVQRADLCWALIQTLASCLWWFHPLMWHVRRVFHRVTELGCDEEVMQRLNCKPVEYARALLMVLERKHQLRVAPALPGVRPVEITSQRMERVMNFERSGKRQRPAMIALFWFVGIVLILPGAQWVTAQDLSKEANPPVKTPAPVNDARSPMATRAQAAHPNADVVVHAEIATVRRYSGSRALARIVKEDNATKEHAAAILNASLDSAAGQGSRVIVVGDQVVARASKSAHKKIEAELERIAAYGFKQQTVISTRVCSMPKSLFDQLQIEWQLQRTEQKQMPLVTATLDQKRVAAAMKLIREDAAGNIMMAPRVTTFNGQRADIETGVQRPFVITGTGNPENNVADATRAWIGRLEFEGMRLSVCPVSNAGKTELEINLSLSKIKAVNDFTFSVADDQKMTVQVPEVFQQSVSVSASVPNAQTIAMGMPSAESPTDVIVCFVSPEPLGQPGEAAVNAFTDEAPVEIANQTAELANQRAELASQRAELASQRAELANQPAETAIAPAVYQAIPSTPLPLPQPSPTLPPAYPSAQSLAIWLFKADGPATAAEVIKQADQALAPFEARTRMEGDWQLSLDGDTTLLSGKHLSVSSLVDRDEGIVLRCPSGSLAIASQSQELTFQADTEGQWDVAVPDMGLRLFADRITMGQEDSEWKAVGKPVKLELNVENIGRIRGIANQLMIGQDGLSLQGEVQFSAAGKTLKADRIEFTEDETIRVLLRGSVHVTSGEGASSTEIRGEGLNLDLSTGEVQLVD